MKKNKNKRLVSQFFKAIGENDEKLVRKLIQQKKKVLLNSRLNFDVCPLHFAAEKGLLSIFKFLLEQGADICLKNNFGWTVIHFAAFNRKIKVLRFILQYLKDNPQINLSIDEVVEYNGYTALHECLQNGLLEPVKVLIEFGANFELLTKEGVSSQELAAKCTTKKMDCLNYLIEKISEKKVKKKEEEWKMLKDELKKHLSLTTEENTRLKNKIKEQEKINDLINRLEESKKKEIDLSSKNLKYEEFFKEEKDLNFFLEEFKSLILRVIKNQEIISQRKISQLFYDEQYYNIINELYKDKSLMEDYIKAIESKYEILEDRKKEFLKLKADNYLFLKTVFFFNELKHNTENSFKQTLETYQKITTELNDKRKNYKKFRVSFNLKKLDEEDSFSEEKIDVIFNQSEEDKTKRKEINFQNKTKEYKNEILTLQRKQENLKKKLFLYNECHTKILFVNYLKKRIEEDFSRETIAAIPKGLLDNWGFLNVLTDRTLEDYYEMKKIGENIYTAKVISPEGKKGKKKDEVVYIKLYSLKDFQDGSNNEVQEILRLYRYTEEEHLNHIMRINFAFIFENALLLRQMCIEIERVPLTLKQFFQSKKNELITKTDIKSIFKPIFETIIWLHSKNIIMRTLSMEKVYFDPLTWQIKLNLFRNVRTIIIGKNEQLQEVYRLDVFDFLGRMLYSALIKELKIMEVPSVKYIDLQTDLSIMDKKFLKDLAEHKNEKEILKSGKAFFSFYDCTDELDEEINMMKLNNLEKIRKSYVVEDGDVNKMHEVEIGYDVLKFLDLFSDQIMTSSLLKEYRVNGQKLYDVADRFLGQLFAPKVKILTTVDGIVYLPSDEKVYPNFFENLGRFYCKCVIEGIRIESFKRLHRLFSWILLKNEQQFTYKDYEVMMKSFNQSFVKQLKTLEKLSFEQLKRLNLFYDVGGIKKELDVEKRVHNLKLRMLKEHLFGKTGNRRENLFSFKKGFFSCLTITQEKSLVQSLTVREMEHLTQKENFSKDLKYEQFIRQIRLINDKTKENMCLYLKKESKNKNSVNYKTLMETIEEKDTLSIEIISMFFEKYNWIEQKFPCYIKWNNYLLKNFFDPFKKKKKKDISNTNTADSFFEIEEEKEIKSPALRLEKYLKENEILIHTFVHSMIEKYKNENFKDMSDFRVELFLFSRLFVEKMCGLPFEMLQTFLDKGPFATPSLYQFLVSDFYCRVKKFSEQNSRMNQKMLTLCDPEGGFVPTLKHFKIEKKLRMDDVQEPYSEAIKKFSSLRTEFNVKGKLDALKESLDLIPKILKKYFENKLSPEELKNFTVGSDEIFPIFLYVVVKSRSKDLMLELKFLNDFFLEDCGPNAYALVNFESAMRYILNDVSLTSMQSEYEQIERMEEDIVEKIGI